jgi:hypothetical protein
LALKQQTPAGRLGDEEEEEEQQKNKTDNLPL